MGDVSRQQSELLDYHVRELNTDGPRRLNARELTQHVSAYVARAEVAVLSTSAQANVHEPLLLVGLTKELPIASVHELTRVDALVRTARSCSKARQCIS